MALKDYGKYFDKTRGIHTAGTGSGYGRGSAGGSRELDQLRAGVSRPDVSDDCIKCEMDA